MSVEKIIRVLVAKVGLDGHDKGALLLCSRLRHAGMEVIYTGLRNTVDQVVATAVQEDVDVIGVSILSGSHRPFAEKIIRKMKEKHIEDRLFVMGGVTPDEDIPLLLNMGVAGVFTQSSNFQEITDFIRNNAKAAGCTT
ncbi:MAG: cobalamin B12-binding domain-containing protein [Syntrophales bacterium LBB04]|nr:cobalamin B12-binding domain-containing protein [Syntrophales bacterium LBB04]